MSDLKKLIARIKNTRGYENLTEVLGKDLGNSLYSLVKESELADKELELTHKCITELYEVDKAVPVIQKYLKKIESLTEHP